MNFKYFFVAILLAPVCVQATEVSKTIWVKHMHTALPTALCNSSNYLRQCYDVTAQQCEETSASATRICLSEYDKDIPDVLVQPEEGTHWGTVVGRCAGEAYAATLASSFKNTPECNDITNWQK